MKIKPGIYPDVPYNDYAAWEAANHSKLVGFKATPAHARELFLYERPPTPAKEFGWLGHLAILEPKRLWQEACVRPTGDGRKKEFKPILDAFKEKLKPGGEHAGKKVVTEEERDDLQGMAASVLAHETAREYLVGPGQNELSICWTDKETGELCKARLDRLAVASKMPGAVGGLLEQPPGSQFALILDLKTHAKPASTREFERSIFNFDYASAAAMYTEGLNTAAPAEELRPFVWVVVETARPYLVRLFTPSADLLQWGHDRWHGWLRQYAECKKQNVWPGWDPGVEEANLPPWAAKVWELGL
jgi:hypothetical protein